MKVYLGIKSKTKLQTCANELQRLVEKACEDAPLDFIITCGHRGKEDQDEAFAKGNSKLKFPNSKHNTTPARAFDFAPIENGKIPWDNIDLFKQLGEHFKKVADEMNIKVSWGGDWRWKDYPHLELI
jgi:peptidoglycan L-alanyl-D-glutamate endopeptidase CwlK